MSVNEIRSTTRLGLVLRHPGAFAMRVLKGFRANQGLLLAGGVAYNALLSLIPLIIVLLIVLSRFLDEERLLASLAAELGLVVPGLADLLVQQLASLLHNWELIGWLGMVVVIFFSSIAFTMLENAMSVVFHHRVQIRRRHFLVSAILPYAYIFLLGIGLLVLTVVGGLAQAVEARHLTFLGYTLPLRDLSGPVLHLLGMLGIVLLLTSVYLVMPVGQIPWRHALIGGVTAGVLWELVRNALVWYFSTLSFVNVVYGSLATAIVTLLSLEAAAIILLLGAQVIAEYERLGPRAWSSGEDGGLIVGPGF